MSSDPPSFQTAEDGLNFYMLGKRIMSAQFQPLTDVSADMVGLVGRMLQVVPALVAFMPAGAKGGSQGRSPRFRGRGAAAGG